MREVLARFPVADRWNVDETGLFPFAPPDCGLAKKQMSGKKASKFCLTLCFACNADGSEKREVFFIGKSKNPRCFGKKGPRERGFYYRNNQTAWMTEALFEEWVSCNNNSHVFTDLHHIDGSSTGIQNCKHKVDRLC